MSVHMFSHSKGGVGLFLRPFTKPDKSVGGRLAFFVNDEQIRILILI